MEHSISRKRLNIETVHTIYKEDVQLSLSQESVDSINACRAYLDTNFGKEDSPAIYGINTGFGSLCNTHIDHTQLEQLQHNLLVSHSCGTGAQIPDAVVRLMLFLKIQSLSYGHSGVSLDVVERLVFFFNNNILPVVYEQGSLGASGDLAPLAHLSLPLIGEGDVMYQGKQVKAAKVLGALGLKPLRLRSKEGLALINGTQFMLAYAVIQVIDAHHLWYWSHITAAMSLDGFDCNLSPFDERIHLIRPHSGQLRSAGLIRELLEDSKIAASEKINVQDPYSFRCVPQVHGATWDTLSFVTKTILTEVNAVTDNPNIFPGSETIISGGNFHGQPLALALDFLAIAVSELGSISERRTFQLMSGTRGLPAFLVNDAGLNSGLMIVQYTAASIASQNKQLCTPASIDSIVSSNGQEDHVSMGANAATKGSRVIENVWTILAIELLAATQALDFRNAATAPFLAMLHKSFREAVPPHVTDRVLHDDIINSCDFIKNTPVEQALLFN
jgi:histidine ammonia-lyase